MLQREKRIHNYIFFILVGLSLYTLLPFLLLTQFIHPVADDFSFAVRDTTLSFWASQTKYYLDWSGRYFSTAIARLNPLIYDALVAYKMYALILLLIFIVTVYVAINTIVQDKLNKTRALALAAMLLVLYILQLPSPSESFYFFSTYVTYQLPNILLLVLLIVIRKFFQAQSINVKQLLIGLATIICAAIIGSNEMALVITFTTVSLITVVNIKHNTYRPYLVFLFIVCIIFCLIAVLAPGNFNRMNEHPNGGRFIWSVVYGGFMTALTFYRWLGPVLAASVIYILYFGLPLADKFKRSSLFAADLRLVILYFLGTIFLMNFTFAWSTGERPTPRLENVIYFFFLFGWFYVLQAVLQKYSKQLILLRQTSQVIPAMAAAIVLLNVLGIENNISTAYVDLISGKAKAYDAALTQRYSLLTERNCRICDVPPLPVIPGTIYFHDIIARSERNTPGIDKEWINRGVANYFQKDSVFLSSPNPPVQDNLSTLRILGKSSLRQKSVIK